MCSFTLEQNKKLIEIYPYLLPRNVWTDKVSEDYDYSFIQGQYDLPDGWFRLFLLYCKAIRPILVSNNYLEKFRFSQIKEKYGSMRMYNFGYAPRVRDQECLYSGYSTFICQRCGKIAKYRTIGWIEQLCEDCYNQSDLDAEKIVKHRKMKIESWSPEGHSIKVSSFKDINTEYKNCMKMSDEEFFNYITTEENYAPKEH